MLKPVRVLYVPIDKKPREKIECAVIHRVGLEDFVCLVLGHAGVTTFSSLF